MRVKLVCQLTSFDAEAVDYVEIPDEEYLALGARERTELLEDYLFGHVGNSVDSHYEITEPPRARP